MKSKIIFAATCAALALMSCKKTESGNKGVVEEAPAPKEILTDVGGPDSTVAYKTDIQGEKTIKTDFVYKATDKSLVKVVFDYNPEKRTVSITNNNKTFVLEKSEARTHETVYKKDDMTATVKGDSLIIHQGENIIELVKTKI